MQARRIRSAIRLISLYGMVLGLCVATLPARAATAQSCDAANPKQVRLQINVSDIRSGEGNITITIYPDQAAHFLDGKYKLARQQLPVKLPVTHACFVVAAPGYYAVALFHDKNNNHHFDTNRLGIPVEGYGFSRNPKLLLGPPDLSEVRFAAYVGDNPIRVKMQHY